VEIGEAEWTVPPVVGKARSRLLSEIGQPLHFEYPAWDPTKVARQDYSKEAIRQFEDEINKHLKKIEDLLNPGKRSTASYRENLHFDWLVLYQIKRMSMTRIAESGDDLSRQGVSVAIHHAAQLLFGECWKEWLRPKTRGGRPPKSPPKGPIAGDDDDGDGE
jgi:hypothetical protein